MFRASRVAAFLRDGLRVSAGLAQEAWRHPGLRAVALSLLTVTAGFLAIHLLALAGNALGSDGLKSLREGDWALTGEGSYSERYEYLLLCGSALALGICALRWRSPLFAVIAVAQLWLAADNAFLLHERAGAALLPGAKHVGELIFLLLSGGGLALATLAALRAASPLRRALAAPSLACIAGLAFCAIGLDALHALGSWSWWTDQAFGFAEDGGELVFITFGAVVSLALLHRAASAPAAAPAHG